MTSVGGQFGLVDSQVFLFDSTGKGLVFNDDTDGINALSSLTYTPTVTGTYYLGISAYDIDPKNASGEYIFPDSPFTGTVAATSTSPLTSWDTAGTTDYGSYTISLTGAQVIAIPEPNSMIGLGILSSLGLITIRRKNKNN